MSKLLLAANRTQRDLMAEPNFARRLDETLDNYIPGASTKACQFWLTVRLANIPMSRRRTLVMAHPMAGRRFSTST